MATVSTRRTHGRALLRFALISIGVIAAIVVIQSLPMFFNKPLGAQVYEDKDVVLYYQPGDEAGARELFDLAKTNIDELQQRMEYKLTSPVTVYVYKAQSSLWIRKYGLATLLVAPSWYVGDSVAGVIRMVSPNAPVRGHTHDTILHAILHETVHSINYRRNPRISYFWDNGLATYLAKQTPAQHLSYWGMPSLEDTHTSNEIKFGEMGGYDYSYSYIEYLDKIYGWDRVLDFAGGGKSFEAVFGVSEQQIYSDWARYLGE